MEIISSIGIKGLLNRSGKSSALAIFLSDLTGDKDFELFLTAEHVFLGQEICTMRLSFVVDESKEMSLKKFVNDFGWKKILNLMKIAEFMFPIAGK